MNNEYLKLSNYVDLFAIFGEVILTPIKSLTDSLGFTEYKDINFKNYELAEAKITLDSLEKAFTINEGFEIKFNNSLDIDYLKTKYQRENYWLADESYERISTPLQEEYRIIHDRICYLLSACDEEDEFLGLKQDSTLKQLSND